MTGIIAATAGSCFAYLAAAAVFDRRAAIWATLAVWLSSSALYYSLISPAYSHAASMLTVGAFWLVWIRTAPRQDLRRYASLGLLAGLSALMRWQDMILLLVPLLDVLWHRRALGFVAACSRIAVIAVAAAVAFVPQMIVWQVLYGRAFTVPQGPGFMHWQDPALLAVLFSQHGLLTWTPILAMAMVGIAFVARRAPLVFVAAVLVLATSWLRQRRGRRLVGRRGLRSAPLRQLLFHFRAWGHRLFCAATALHSRDGWRDCRLCRVYAAAAPAISDVHARLAAGRTLS